MGITESHPAGAEAHLKAARRQLVRLAVTPLGIKIPNMPAAYHSSIALNEMEFTFSGKGIVTAPNFQSHRHRPSEVFELGSTFVSTSTLVKALRPFFKKGTYDLLRKNCNSFSDCALFYLLGKRLDEKYKVMEKIGNTADRNLGIVRVFSLGDYVPNPKASGFVLEETVQRIGRADQSGDKAFADHGYTMGQGVEVYSKTNRRWVKASIHFLHNDGRITVKYNDQDLQKDVPAEEVSDVIRHLAI
mmetsp:Transcript_47712/g.102241  ORF Transcript_47712/g.102241 Transcript_47712/m.102241 type:complete len:245 (-) Transcript_47712:390-1124(-)